MNSGFQTCKHLSDGTISLVNEPTFKPRSLTTSGCIFIKGPLDPNDPGFSCSLTKRRRGLRSNSLNVEWWRLRGSRKPFSSSACLSLGEATGSKPRLHRCNPRRSAALVLGSSALTWWPQHVPAEALGLRSAAPGAAARARPGPAPQAAHLGEWEDAALRRGWGGGVGQRGRDECGRRGLWWGGASLGRRL